MSIDNTDLVIRPIQAQDLDSLYEVASVVGAGFTSLPADRAVLEKRIYKSENSFGNKIPRGQQNFLLVMEDTAHKKFVGMCGIKAKVGDKTPFYNYKVSTISQCSADLDIYLEHQILQLVNDFQDASELGSLFLHEHYRGHRRGEFLSRARFLLMAQFPAWFSKWVIAEIRGVINQDGHSPFWDAVGKHFFAMEFAKADYLTVSTGKQFIADLIPHHPIYMDFLPAAARAVIGQPHPSSAPAKYLLEKEGFLFHDYIDIFDAGPLLTVSYEAIDTIRQNAVFEIASCPTNVRDSTIAMVSNTNVDFHLTLAQYRKVSETKVELDAHSAKQLAVTAGDKVNVCPFGNIKG